MALGFQYFQAVARQSSTLRSHTVLKGDSLCFPVSHRSFPLHLYLLRPLKFDASDVLSTAARLGCLFSVQSSRGCGVSSPRSPGPTPAPSPSCLFSPAGPFLCQDRSWRRLHPLLLTSCPLNCFSIWLPDFHFFQKCLFDSITRLS